MHGVLHDVAVLGLLIRTESWPQTALGQAPRGMSRATGGVSHRPHVVEDYDADSKKPIPPKNMNQKLSSRKKMQQLSLLISINRC